jgi:Na+-driven multidrug efflux pump
LLHVGLPAAGTNLIIPAATAVVLPLVAGYGPGAVAGVGVAVRIEAVTMVVFYAMSAIMGPFAGHNLGAGRVDRIRQAIRQCAFFCLAWGAGVAVLLALAGGALAGLFNEQAAVVSAARLYLLVVPIGYGAAGIIMVLNAAFNGMGRPMPAVALSAIRMFGLYVPLAYGASSLFGLAGVFAATALSNLAVGQLGYLMLARICPRVAAR